MTPEDWRILDFYSRVSTQYVNQTPMGTKDGRAVLTPRLEGIESALRIWQYPKDEWGELARWASWLITAVHDRDAMGELPVSPRDMRPMDWR